jgi:hypothetical protein
VLRAVDGKHHGCAVFGIVRYLANVGGPVGKPLQLELSRIGSGRSDANGSAVRIPELSHNAGLRALAQPPHAYAGPTRMNDHVGAEHSGYEESLVSTCIPDPVTDTNEAVAVPVGFVGIAVRAITAGVLGNGVVNVI